VPKRVLILDDEPEIGRFMSRVAESAGFAALVKTTASQFFEELESWNPTHIVLDLIMPDLDGVEVLGELARQNCRASIIIVSGVGNRVLDAAFRTGRAHGLVMSGVLSKPFSPARLRKLLDRSEADGQTAGTLSGMNLTKQTDEVTAAEFQKALDNQELEVFFQPKVNCRNDHLAGFEALVRWSCPERGLVLPGLFIPIAETSGLMGKMTDQVIEQALSWFSEFLDGLDESTFQDDPTIEIIRELTLSINLSARSLDDPAFFEFVVDQCRRASIEPRRIIFELTESSALQDPVASLKLLTRLRVRGFQLSIDDFGSGFSSMIQLVRLPFSEVKLDRSFVMAALRSEEARAVIHSIITLSHSLGLVTTGEGVEDLNTFDYLSRTDCDLAQGHLLSRPIAGAEAMKWGQDHLETWRGP